MQIFAVTRQLPSVTLARLASAVEHAAQACPRLDLSTLLQFEASSGVRAAAISHGDGMAAPRRYRARRDGSLVLFDGLPVDRHGAFPGHDAAALLDRWADLPQRLEGAFSAVRIDGRTGEIECLLDVLGLAQVYVARCGPGWALSNSVEVLRLVTDRHAPDALGISSLLALGWVAGDQTLVEGIEVLPGGHLHRFGAEGHEAQAILSPATVVPRGMGPPPRIQDLAATMTRTMAAAGEVTPPVTCGLTAGRESRVMLALALAGDVPTQYVTSALEENVDLRVARELARRLALPHRVISPVLPTNGESWRTLTSRYVAQTDGLASLWDVADWTEHQQPAERLGLKLWGAGGEIGRSARVGVGIPFMANTPGFRASWAAQRWVLEQKARAPQEMLTSAAIRETLDYLDRYLEHRREEGWRPGEALESYYAFERVKHWAATGVRRAAEGIDVFAPFVCRDYITCCYALSAGHRYREAVQYGLLAVLSAPLPDLGFDVPWKPQRPRATTPHVLAQALQWALPRLRRNAAPPAGRALSFGRMWFEAGLPVHRDLCLSFSSSPLWDFVDRRRYEILVRGTSEDRAPHAEALSRVLTAFWYFHGRETLTPDEK